MDGQHRLWAVIESGVSLNMWVMRGIDSTTMEVLDTGKHRSLADFLHMQDEPYARSLAGALSCLWSYDQTGIVSSDQWDIAPFATPWGLQLLDDNPELRQSLVHGDRVRKVLRGGCGRWTTLHYILSRINKEDAHTFFEMLCTGENIPTQSPVGLLRKRLINNMRGTMRLGQKEYTALVLKAWNMYRRGETAKTLSYKPGGAHPEEYPTPI